MTITATVTEKGQVTIPRKIRDVLKSRIIEFVLEGEHIEIRGVPSVSGVFREYAKAYVPLEEVREIVWGRPDGK